jgi:hypothetical protein
MLARFHSAMRQKCYAANFKRWSSECNSSIRFRRSSYSQRSASVAPPYVSFSMEVICSCMSSVSSCRTRCGYPEHAAAIKHPEVRLPRRPRRFHTLLTVFSALPRRFDTVILSRNVPTVSTVLPAPRCARYPSNARIVAGHGQASVAGHSLFAATFRPLRPPYPPPPTLGRMIHSIRPFSWAHYITGWLPRLREQAFLKCDHI